MAMTKWSLVVHPKGSHEEGMLDGPQSASVWVCAVVVERFALKLNPDEKSDTIANYAVQPNSCRANCAYRCAYDGTGCPTKDVGRGKQVAPLGI
eukprot:4938434-Pyramimonas_sp.AAC.2